MDETLAKLFKRRPVYAASRMSQLRKSSSAASQSVNYLQPSEICTKPSRAQSQLALWEDVTAQASA
jgi:hypothetical protein